ncbi:DUF4430 domain-containing protein [Virgibacillus halodenitrificans]|uniref:DUF4430 domain-containing protein n=1 Tax=Virgibacillus halodenitrificans TaxID=1482 RepID=UPI002DBCD9DC|nr:DUF4430 domain-containing protein [Virgibacillus halodenitrificans]MEC2160360.1 DUF4430 domain-containing protein [Virgibacillus halodenitrificans]
MIKKPLQLGIILIIICLLAGCGDEMSKKENTVLITISKDNGSEYLHEKEISVEKGNNILDVMMNNFYVETNSRNDEITSIERLSIEENKGKQWYYTVNGEATTENPKNYELKPGDKIVFDFHSSK